MMVVLDVRTGESAMSQQVPSTAPPRNSLGSAALVLGIVALVFALVPIVGDFVSVPAAVLAVVLGVVGLLRAEKGVATNGGAALAGVVLGFVAGFITLLVVAATSGV
jgi:hypothetical protein